MQSEARFSHISISQTTYNTYRVNETMEKGENNIVMNNAVFDAACSIALFLSNG